MIVFFDASALIYLLQGREPFAGRVRAELAKVAQAHPDAGTAVSRLSWLECRVGPMKANDAAALALFDTFFARPDLVWVELDREVVELAAAIRVRHGLRTPDALQAASCLQLGPQHLLLTGDAAFQRVQGLNVMVLS
ncbi:MAG: PIN domain-containing protein [Acidovorax sp.]